MAGLTPRKIDSIKTPGRYTDVQAPTLHLFAQEGKRGLRKSWVQRITVQGKRRELGLGPWPLVTLEEARSEALENRRMARRGLDPLAERRKASVRLFRDAAQATIRLKEKSWKNPAEIAAKWASMFERYAYPAIGGAPIQSISQADLIAILKPLGEKHPSTAKILRKRICTVFKLAQAHGHIEGNPCEAIEAALPSTTARVQHRKAIPHSELGRVLGALYEGGSGISVKACIKFLAATAARSQEAAQATWSEIDLDAKTWTIPAERMKTGDEFTVPLNGLAIEALNEAQTSGKEGLLFANQSGQSLSHNALLRAMKKATGDPDMTIHGLRSSFRQWAADTGDYPRELAEAALAHTVGNAVEASYQRSSMVARRVPMMAAWSEYLTGAGE